MAGDGDARLEAVRKRTGAEITHPDRVLYPAAGLTKLDVIEYYLEVAPFLLPYLRGRPLTLHRFPAGVGGEGFFAKDAPAGTPSFVETFTHWAEAPGRDVDFVLCNNLDTLAWLANIAAIELHATLSRAASYDSPDFLFVDIDPEPPFDFDDVIGIARMVRDCLEARRLRPFVKTSGKKGLHVVPLAAGHTFSALREFAHGVGRAVARAGIDARGLHVHDRGDDGSGLPVRSRYGSALRQRGTVLSGGQREGPADDDVELRSRAAL